MSITLRLSAYCQPQLRHGRGRLHPANMQEGEDRLAYLGGMVRYFDLLFAELPEDEVLAQVQRVPFARELLERVELEGGARLRERKSARSEISFDETKLGIALIDGRNRRATPYFATGAATQDWARAIAKLAAGTGDPAPLDGHLDALIERGLVEHGELEVDPRFLGQRDRLTWLGHAALIFQSRDRTVWVDPYLPPRIAWSDDDRALCFSDAYAERRLFEPYHPNVPNLALSELPRPDAVCITHQDSDHLELGVLMCVPEDVPIVVPKCAPDRPWEVDLARLIHRVLGPERRVVSLGHGEVLELGAIRIRAFPFAGEMPLALPHSWNAYLLEGAESSVACTADSRIDEAAIAFLERHARTPLLLCAGPPRAEEIMPGWREGLATTNLYNSSRLWGWYVPPVTLFHPTPCSNVTAEQLDALARRAGLAWYLPYAMGSAPWFRIRDPRDPLHLGVSSLSLAELDAIEASLGPNVALFPARYGRPTPLTRA